MQAIDTDTTIKQLIYAYKGNSFCSKERSDFVLCRATPAGKLGDPEMCEGKVANFLQCYHDMVKTSRASCQPEFKKAYDCLKSNFNDSKAEEKEGTCSHLLEEFGRCGTK